MKIKFKILILIGVIVIMGILGFGKLSFKQIEEEKSFAVDAIDKIRVNVTTETIQISEADSSGNIRFRLNGKAMMQEVKLSTQVNGNTLAVSIERERNLPEDIRLEIYIPTDFIKDLAINTTTGIVKIDSASLNSFILTTNSGGMKAEHLSAGEVSITTSSGSINAVKIDTKKLDIQSKTASVSIDECLTESAEIKASSGSITVNESSGNLNVKGETGKVLVNCKRFEEQSISIETTTGSITLQLPDTAEFLLEARTSTGKLQSDFPVNIDSKKMMGQIGTKDNRIDLQTSKGSISLLKR